MPVNESQNLACLPVKGPCILTYIHLFKITYKYKTMISTGRLMKWWRAWLLPLLGFCSTGTGHMVAFAVCATVCAAAGRTFFSAYCFWTCFNWLWEAENTGSSQIKLFIHTELWQKLGKLETSIFLPVSLTFWWLWPEKQYLQPACRTSQSGMLEATLRCSALWTTTEERSHQTHVPLLTSRSVVSTDCMLMSPSCNHTHP